MKVHGTASKNADWLREQLKNSSDLVLRRLHIENYEYLVTYIEALADTDSINEHLLRPMLDRPEQPFESVISIIDMEACDNLEKVLDELLTGKSAVQKDGEPRFLLMGTEINNDRAVNLPTNEKVIRGTKQAFIESFETNVYMIRTYASSKHLMVQYHNLGGMSKTKVAIAYMDNKCGPEIVKELTCRIEQFSSKDTTVTLGYVKGIILGKSYTFFPTLLETERPDRAKAYLMEGKAVIIVEGIADVLVVPISFWSFFQSPDDYNANWFVGSLFRSGRFLCLLLTLLLPAIYIVFTSFIPNVLPMPIALTLQSALKFISFTPIIEMLSMMIVFEIIREGAIRLASPIAQTIGIVGGVVLGTAIVQSNIVSNTAIITIALAGLASFAIPVYEMSSAIRIYSFVMVLSAHLFGFVGIAFGFLLLLIHLSRLRILGEPYFTAVFPFLDQMRDTLLRMPVRKPGTGKK
ncbi:spore germination protein [Paenibacillus sp. strain BS8-2]